MTEDPELYPIAVLMYVTTRWRTPISMMADLIAFLVHFKRQ